MLYILLRWPHSTFFVANSSSDSCFSPFQLYFNFPIKWMRCLCFVRPEETRHGHAAWKMNNLILLSRYLCYRALYQLNPMESFIGNVVIYCFISFESILFCLSPEFLKAVREKFALQTIICRQILHTCSSRSQVVKGSTPSFTSDQTQETGNDSTELALFCALACVTTQSLFTRGCRSRLFFAFLHPSFFRFSSGNSYL